MIYKIRTELEQGIKLLAEAEDALKADSIDAARLSRLEQLSAPTDAMVILKRQAAYRERFDAVFKGLEDYKARHPVSKAPLRQNVLSIDELVKNGREFYSEEKDSEGKYVGVAVALQQAYDEMGADVVIASMPYLIAGKAQADKKNYLWQNWFTALSEENAGIDKNGKFVGAGEEVIITLHGGGILMPERIRQAYGEGLTPQNAAGYTDDEFDNLLDGILPSGESIKLYTLDDVKKGIPEPFGRYAVWMPAEAAKITDSGYHKKKEFMENPLVIARAGTLEHLETYFDKAKHKDGTVGNWHRFGEIDFRQPQGRLLFVDNTYNGLGGHYDLDDSGRFVGVAPEAPVGARKN